MADTGNLILREIELALKNRGAARALAEILPGVGRTWRDPNTMRLNTRPPRLGWNQITGSEAAFSEATVDGFYVGRKVLGTTSDTMRLEYLDAQGVAGVDHYYECALPSAPFLDSTDPSSGVGVGIYDPGAGLATLLDIREGRVSTFAWTESTDGRSTLRSETNDVLDANGVPLVCRLTVTAAGAVAVSLGVSGMAPSVLQAPAGAYTDPRFCWWYVQGSNMDTPNTALLWDLHGPVLV